MKIRDCWCGMQGLEQRMMLSGNVTVEVVRGTLRIKGDGAGNDIRVDGAGGMHITGRNNTTINGSSEFFGSAGRRARINLGGGDNRLSVFGFYERGAGDLLIKTGDGDDAVFLDSTNTKSLIIRTGGGKDVVSLLGTLGQKAIINTGDDADFVSLHRAFEDDWTVRTGGGDDIIFHKEMDDENPIFRAGTGRNVITSSDIELTYDFEKDDQGWKAGFADNFASQQTNGDLDSGLVTKPYSSQSRQRFVLQGINRTDDLFMYLTHQLSAADGLKPNTQYLVNYEVDFDSNAESGCIGVGGAPGESVYLKAGASTGAPRTKADEDGVLRLNLDHGAQAEGGKAATVLGNIANGEECGTSQPPGIFISTERRGVHESLVKTDSKGRMHLLVGTDSAFEGQTTLYFSKIVVQLVQAFGKPRGPEDRYTPVG